MLHPIEAVQMHAIGYPQRLLIVWSFLKYRLYLCVKIDTYSKQANPAVCYHPQMFPVSSSISKAFREHNKATAIVIERLQAQQQLLGPQLGGALEG